MQFRKARLPISVRLAGSLTERVRHNLAQALHDNRDLLGHVHIADNHRYQPGSGTLDFHALFEQLRADNYQGYVVYEGRIRAEDPAQAYRDSLAWLRTC